MRFEKEKRESCKLAKNLLAGNSLYLDNIVRLSYLGNSIHGQCWDTEFHIFGLIASDTDHLPLQKVREHCSQEFLKRSDAELLQIIQSYAVELETACKEVLNKYGNV